MSSIKETTELFEGLALIAKGAKEIAKDGKVDFSDLSIAVELVKSSSILIEAVKGVDQIPSELKDLSQEELLEIIMIVYKKVTEVSGN